MLLEWMPSWRLPGRDPNPSEVLALLEGYGLREHLRAGCTGCKSHEDVERAEQLGAERQPPELREAWLAGFRWEPPAGES